MKVAGIALPHESADGHVTGSALYTDDLVGRFPGVLHAWPVISPHAHARVIEIDVSPALRHPGRGHNAHRSRCSGRRRFRSQST
jgi:xanthine dehydrogenase large subunit